MISINKYRINLKSFKYKMDKHIEWLLSLVESIKLNFYDDSIENNIKKYLNECVIERSSNQTEQQTPIVVDNSILNGNAQFFLIANDPQQIYYDIIIKLKDNLSELDKCKFRPLTIITKLANREFIFDIAGNQIIYGISSKYVDNSILKSIYCRHIYMIKNYFNHIDKETHAILPTFIKQLTDDGTTTIGGHSKKIKNQKKQNSTPRINIKIKILGRLVEYIKTNNICMNSLIYLNNIESIDNHAMDIIYSDNRAKSGVIDYLKLLIQEQYTDYKFEINPHQGYSIPYDFRLRKLSIYIKNRKTNQNSYLVNLYNTAMYDPIPSFKLNNQFIAHPLVRLRFLYLDQFLLNSSQKEPSAFNTIIQKMIDNTLNDLINLKNKIPEWIGIYHDENYDRNQENMKSNVQIPYDVMLL